jgi:hypothetical protein
VHQFVFDDLVRPFLVANDLTDAIEIALEQIDGNDERGAGALYDRSRLAIPRYQKTIGRP